MRKTIKGALMTAGLTLLMGLSLNVNQPAKVTAATEAITFSLNKGTGVSGTTYVTNSPAFTISGTGFVANNFNPNTGQVRGSGNVTTNFLMYNTTALPGRLVSIEMTFNSTNKDTSGTGRNALSVGNAVITSGSAQIPITTQTYTNYTWIVPTGTDGTFFHLYNFESSGTVLNTGITITYEVGGGGPVNPTGLTINGDSSVTAGQTITLSVTAAPEGSMDAVSWESSNDNIATINQEGVVAGIAEGDATITATSIYDTNVYATHVVSVLPRGEGPQEYYVDITRDNFPSGNLAYTTPSKWTATGNDGTPLEGYASVTTNATQIQTNQSGTREPFRNSTPLPGPLVRVELNLAQGTPRTHTIYVSTDTEITNANYTTAGTNVGTITPTGSLEVSSAADYRYFNFRSVSSASYLSSIRVTYLIIPVAQVPVASIGITGSDSVEIGATIGLSATVLPEDATNKNVTWSTSNASVATVDAATGVVTGVSQGTANIYATATDGSNVVSPAHAITVTTVNYNAAEAVMEALDALYEKVVNETLTLLDEADFQTIMGDYDSLSSIQKTYFDEYDSGYYLSVIDEIEAAFQALHDDVAATVVENTINALPSVDELTLDDRSAVEAARSAYDSLTASQKAFVDIVYVQKLEALEAKILELDPVKKYTRVTGADQLHVGAEYLITNFNATPSTSNTNTFSTTPTSNNIPGVAVTEMTNGQIIENANYQVLRFGAGEQSSEYALEAVNGTSTGKFLRPGSSSSNFLRYEDTLTTDSSWTIDISSDGTATIVASRSSYTRNIMRYNPNSGSPIFSCYNAGQQAISLWLDERTIPAVKELVTGIEITGPTTVDVAETIQLNATITPENADEHGVVWVSSNTSVATVSTTGVVTGVAEGQTTIRATAIDGSGVYDEHIVTVHDALINQKFTDGGDFPNATGPFYNDDLFEGTYSKGDVPFDVYISPNLGARGTDIEQGAQFGEATDTNGRAVFMMDVTYILDANYLDQIVINASVGAGGSATLNIYIGQTLVGSQALSETATDYTYTPILSVIGTLWFEVVGSGFYLSEFRVDGPDESIRDLNSLELSSSMFDLMLEHSYNTCTELSNSEYEHWIDAYNNLNSNEREMLENVLFIDQVAGGGYDVFSIMHQFDYAYGLYNGLNSDIQNLYGADDKIDTAYIILSVSGFIALVAVGFLVIRKLKKTELH